MNRSAFCLADRIYREVSMLILNSSDVRKALPMDAAIQAVKEGYAALSGGDTEMPLRGQLPVRPHQGVILSMPAFVNAHGEALAIKLASVFPDNPSLGLPIIHAAVLIFEPNTGKPIAILEGGSLTAIRTGAASGAATDILARDDSQTAAIFGAGVQGRTQLEAVCTARTIETAWVYDLDKELVKTFISEMAGQGVIPTDLRAAETPEQAVSQADIVCTATTAQQPVYPYEALKAGTHINGVGSFTLEMIENPPDMLAHARVFIDSHEAIMEEAGEVVAAIIAGHIQETTLTELGTVVAGKAPGRGSPDEITFFKSVGVAVQDAMTASVALENAQKLNLGQKVSW
jgi:ornithine cyclodeaminase/alanine dehydrogenase-like protein (mu-crystallin family)